MAQPHRSHNGQHGRPGYDTIAAAVGPHVASIITQDNASITVGNPTYVQKDSPLESKIQNWLPLLDFRKVHAKTREVAKIQEQTDLLSDGSHAGKWLLDSDEFGAWRSRELTKLWFIGMRKSIWKFNIRY